MSETTPRQNKRPLEPLENNNISPKHHKKIVSFEDSVLSNKTSPQAKGSIVNPIVESDSNNGNSSSTPQGLDVQQIHKLMGMNDQYNAQKTKAAEAFVFDKSDIGAKSNIQHEIDYLNDRLPKLTEEHKQLFVRLNEFEEDIRDIKRNNQKIILKNKELQNLITINQRKFENLENSITKNVMNREELVNYKIKEFKQKLKSQVEELKFALKEELNLAKSYRDEDIEKTIENLEDKKVELKKQIANMNNKTEHLLKDAKLELDKDLNNKLSCKRNKNESLKIEFETKQKEVSTLKELFNELEASRASLLNESERLLKMNNNLQENADNYSVSKSNLTNKLTTVERKMTKLVSIGQEYSSNLKKTNEIYTDVENQYNKSENTVLALENSILQLETKKRVYINTSCKDFNYDNDRIAFKDLSFKVHKVLETTNSENMLKEFKYYITSVLKSQQSSTIILCGDQIPEDIAKSLVTSLYERSVKMWPTSTSSCKAVGVLNSIHDLFDSERKIDSVNKSQVMIVDDPENFSNVVERASSFFGAKIFDLTIDSTKQANYRIMDVTSLSKDQQFSNIVIKSLIKEYENSFHFCQIDDFDDSVPLFEHLISF